MIDIGIEIVLLVLWLAGGSTYLYWKKRKIHQEIEEQRQQSRETFSDLRECVGEVHSGR